MNGEVDIESTTRTAIALVVLLAISAGAANVAATKTEASTPTLPSEDAFVVSVHADGDAEVSLVTAFNLTADAEKQAFRQFQENETKRTHLRQQFAENLRNVVAEVDGRTERDMGIADPTVAVTTADDGRTGVVAVSVTWTNLAAERNGSLVVEEPFASGFETGRIFVLRAPDGYALADATPTPDASRDAAATWTPNSSLDGFQVAMEPARTDGDASTTSEEAADGVSGSIPGFGPVAALVAIIASAVLATRR